jgi:hypothetical protein
MRDTAREKFPPATRRGVWRGAYFDYRQCVGRSEDQLQRRTRGSVPTDARIGTAGRHAALIRRGVVHRPPCSTGAAGLPSAAIARRTGAVLG